MKKLAEISIKKLIIIDVILAVIFCIVAFWQGLVVKEYTIESDEITKEISFVVVSDLHSVIFGEGQSELVSKIDAASPDAILIPGDIADEETPIEGTKLLLEKIAHRYPCFYVTGNHEYYTNDIDGIIETIESYGVTVLSGETTEASINNQTITIGGVDDPAAFYEDGWWEIKENDRYDVWEDQVYEVCDKNQREGFSVLLTHRPEYARHYKNRSFDLVVAGHAHGGQFRIPGIINGIYSPGQGLFPEYTGGVYDIGDTKMVVSRGLCINWKPRFFNPPELTVINIEPKNKE